MDFVKLLVLFFALVFVVGGVSAQFKADSGTSDEVEVSVDRPLKNYLRLLVMDFFSEGSDSSGSDDGDVYWVG